MTTYNQLFGKYVQNLSSDPTSTDAEGQIWYNSTSGTFKTALGNYATWSSGGNLPVAKNSGAADGTSTAAWTAGGSSGPTGNTGMNQTDLYNGTSWTTSGNLNTARTGVAGFGTQTAAVAAGGYIQPGAGPTRTMYANTENFNGSAWTTSGALSSGRSDGGACGIQTAGLYFGGSGGYGGPSLATTAKYNGTAWTAVNSMNTAGSYTRAGTQTAALASISDTAGKGTESYNGTVWTVGTSRNIAGAQMAGFGLQTAAYLAGGYSAGPGTPQFSTTEYWNGSVWTNTASLATARRAGMGIGTQSGTSGLITGGTTASPYITATEAYNNYGVSVPVAGSWSSGGALNTARYGLGGAGTQTAALAFGGNTGPAYSTATEAFNGTSWTNGGNMNVANHRYTMGTGTQTAALAAGGDGSGTPGTTSTEKYNGTAWTTNPTGMNTGRFVLAGVGNQTATLAFGGDARPPTGPTFLYSNLTESFNGSTWTVVNTLNTGRQGIAGAGTQTAALGFGGNTGSVSAATESWNGSAWTTVNSMNTARKQLGGAGTQTSALGFGGTTGTPTTTTEIWNGTSWATSPGSMGTARYSMATAGNQTSALGAGGYAPQTTTELWTGPSTTLNYKTLTTS